MSRYIQTSADIVAQARAVYGKPDAYETGRCIQIPRGSFAVTDMSKKWREEWAFFIGENGRRQYNRICRGCTHACKQSFRVILIECPCYVSGGRKNVAKRVQKTRNNLLHLLF